MKYIIKLSFSLLLAVCLLCGCFGISDTTSKPNEYSENTIKTASEEASEKKDADDLFSSLIKDNEDSDSSKSESKSSSTKKEESKKEESEENHEALDKDSKRVYVTPTGKRYHLDPDCGGKNSTETDLETAKARGLTPCKKCAQ